MGENLGRYSAAPTVTGKKNPHHDVITIDSDEEDEPTMNWEAECDDLDNSQSIYFHKDGSPEAEKSFSFDSEEVDELR